MIGSMISDNAMAPAIPEKWPMVITTSEYTKRPITIDGMPATRSTAVRTAMAARPSRYSTT